jgi:glutamate dehydrogenase
MLRAYAAYMKQIGFGISKTAIANTLVHHVQIAQLLIRLFHIRFNPGYDGKETAEALETKIIEALDKVPSLTEDRIIRMYLTLMQATLRTNFFQLVAGQPKPYFSFKLAPRLIPEIPQPRPLFEIFVYSPRVIGVHLRGGKVARGGLRWSDRPEDFRTEVLGLVKAQQVKNAVIVPVGAKGGFVPKQITDNMSREERMEEGIRCYKDFIRGLLDITDNLVEGEVVAPENTVRHDEDDTYLVVAADKGTATFSDIANGIANEYGFWLGDAFASGGSQGYDHKKMGITAKGAWVSVERHFRELGINTRTTEHTSIGIGDMSGDVFGNGMLLSPHTQLVAAFNHMHIFVDPNPNQPASFAERQRMFDLPRSTWEDYNTELISSGGGLFSRLAKSILISQEMKDRFAIQEDRLTPNELVSALLKAPVDLLWNGGIGTYVKSSSESHADVGDKANDSVRINGNELRCRVIGEGGNLGMTQLARVEYGLNGGDCNTDFIDNVGGVDCSDHEVNIKILLNEIVANGDMTEKQRNKLLTEMTDEVGDLVLENSYRQVQAISIAHAQSLKKMAEYRRLISSLEEEDKLSRALEFIPDDETLAERRQSGVGLSRAELSVLISYSKANLKEDLVASDIPQNAYLARELDSAFPGRLRKQYANELHAHRLQPEIVATQIANHLVNHMGITYLHRMKLSTGCSSADITKAYILSREIFGLSPLWEQIEALDNCVTSDVQVQMMLELQRLVRRASRWFLRNRRSELDVAAEVALFAAPIAKLSENFGEWLQGRPAKVWKEKFNYFQQAGVPDQLASVVASADSLYVALGMIEVAGDSGSELQTVVEAYCSLGERLDLYWFGQQLTALEVDNQWQALAREAFRDDLDWQMHAITTSVLRRHSGKGTIGDCIDSWMDENHTLVERWLTMLSELKSVDRYGYSMFTVAIRELFDMAKGSTITEQKSDQALIAAKTGTREETKGTLKSA